MERRLSLLVSSRPRRPIAPRAVLVARTSAGVRCRLGRCGSRDRLRAMQHAGNRNGNGEPGEHAGGDVSAELVRLRRGELTVEEYLDSHVEQALDLVRGR